MRQPHSDQSRGDAVRRILIAHGTRKASGVAMIEQLADLVSQRIGQVDVAFVDVLGPNPAELLHRRTERTILVPCFLAAGYHVRVDVPAHVARSGHRNTVLTAALGPDRALVPALVARLKQVGWKPGDTVVLGATGSSDPRARADVHTMADYLADALGDNTVGDVRVGFLAAGEPTVATVLDSVDTCAARVFIASYQLADGLFHSKLAELGAAAVTEPLGLAPEVVDLIVSRFSTAVG